MRSEIREKEDKLYLDLMRRKKDNKCELIIKQINSFIEKVDFYDRNFNCNFNKLIQNMEKLDGLSNNKIINNIINNKNKIFDSKDWVTIQVWPDNGQ